MAHIFHIPIMVIYVQMYAYVRIQLQYKYICIYLCDHDQSSNSEKIKHIITSAEKYMKSFAFTLTLRHICMSTGLVFESSKSEESAKYVFGTLD